MQPGWHMSFAGCGSPEKSMSSVPKAVNKIERMSCVERSNVSDPTCLCLDRSPTTTVTRNCKLRVKFYYSTTSFFIAIGNELADSFRHDEVGSENHNQLVRTAHIRGQRKSDCLFFYLVNGARYDDKSLF